MDKIKVILKNNKFIYNVYNIIYSNIFKFINKLIKKDEQLALFVVYAGKRYDDSPKLLYEYLKNNSEYANIRCIWAFQNCEKFSMVNKMDKVKIDSIKYFYYAMKSKYWITNSSVQRGLNFKTSQVYVNFQHGTTGIKLLGKSMPKDNKSFKYKKSEDYDYIFVQGYNDIKWLSRDLEIDKKHFYLTGLPRSIELLNKEDDYILYLKHKLKIPLDKKIILYAPTFREYKLDGRNRVMYENPFDIEFLKSQLSDEYIFLMTSHYEVTSFSNQDIDNAFVINIFEPENFNDLILCSDIIITDYSSVTFDAFVAEKCVLCFAYDYDLYMKSRGGTYLDLNELFSHGVIRSQAELIDIIKNMDIQFEQNFSKKQKEKYIYINENVVEECANIIFYK